MKDQDKLYAILMETDVVSSIRNNLDELISVIPEIKYMIGFPHNHPHHHLDVFEHTLLAISFADFDFTERLCLLLHDIGKPFSYQEGVVRHFKGHPYVSAKMSDIILNRLCFSKDFIEEVCYLIKYHDTPITDFDIEENFDLTYKRFKIQMCDAYAHNPLKLEKRIAYLKDIANKLGIDFKDKTIKK